MDVPLFAADWVGVVVGVIFLLVSAASAISNMAKEKNKAQPGKVKEKAALQRELEKFLQDAMNPQQKKKERPVEVDFFDEEDEVETQASVPQQPQQRRRQQRKSQPSRDRSQQGQQVGTSVVSSTEKSDSKPHVTHRERAVVEAEARHKRLGGGLRDRIEKKQKSHIQSKIHSTIGSKVGNHLSDTFGSRGPEPKQSGSKTGGSKAIRAMLRNPRSFRQAIILNEILSPPKSRRRS